MRRIATAAVALLLAALVCALVPSAGSAAARFSVTVNRTELHSGQRLVVHAHATTRCTWLAEWSGQRQHVVARTWTTTFVAPAVTRTAKQELRVTCFYDDLRPERYVAGGGSSTTRGADAQTVVVRIPPSWVHVIPVVVDPGAAVSPPHGGPGGAGGNGGVGPGALPGTGGPPWWLLLAGFLCILSGATAVRQAARDRGAP